MAMMWLEKGVGGAAFSMEAKRKKGKPESA